MEIQFLGTGAGQSSKQRNVSSLALKLLDELNEIWLLDVREATQHQILHTNIRPRKITKIFTSHNHGDHIFGLPGLLSTRSFQGDVGPLTIYRPAGLEQFITTALRISKTKVSYPIHFVELKDGQKILENAEFSVYCKKLDHRVASSGFRVVEKSRPGVLLMDKLAPYHLPNGPILGQLKAGKVVELEDGRVLSDKGLSGPEKKGRIVTIIYDTRITFSIAELAQDADVLVHESTFAGPEGKMAKAYYHSTATQATEITKKANVKCLFLTHMSARCLGSKVHILEKQAQRAFLNTVLISDLDIFDIPMRG